ncbi:hypothetical protein [Serratia sp. AKBS12]|uniref:hypothetical protein n=1 Tax=Serratia sp. AKBS12 TaxID=2974597 RepID=UPI002165FF6B|nr:hypothetical protein [Serratia sp. AKBS12]HEI8865008.1 hypothetical protein [Serratia odorifera]
MFISLLVLLYAILMVAVGLNEIYCRTTGNSAFLLIFLFILAGCLTLLALFWRLTGRQNRNPRR